MKVMSKDILAGGYPVPNKPIPPEWQKLDDKQDNCMYCQSPLEIRDACSTCNRCWRLQQNLWKDSSELTDDELYELEEYSRFLHTVAFEREEREIEELGRRLNAAGRFKS
jgi:hypothetical protein